MARALPRRFQRCEARPHGAERCSAAAVLRYVPCGERAYWACRSCADLATARAVAECRRREAVALESVELELAWPDDDAPLPLARRGSSARSAPSGGAPCISP